MTPEAIEHAKKFLAAVREAMQHAAEIESTVEEYQEVEGQSWHDNPPLLKQTASWEVDKDEIEQYRSLLNFMRRALFGVDCDSDNAVFFSVVDRTREENFLPYFRVQRVDWNDGDLSKRFAQIEAVESIIASAQERLRPMRECFSEDLRRKFRYEKRLRLAKGCQVCDGKGWVESTYEEWNKLDYSDKCRTEDIGCNRRAENPAERRYSRDKFRLFCECQVEKKDEDE